MRQRTPLTSMTQFALQVVPRAAERTALELVKKAQRPMPCACFVPSMFAHPLTRRCVCRNTPTSMRCDEKLHNCLAVIFKECRSNEEVRVDQTRRHKRVRSPRRRGFTLLTEA